ncbi:hypothetical protein CU048_13215 [Beijerinckiaceae bacterium]|nr:hypothetical protein CU048_13215 [Beijerinckiaceae bacterium]
MTASPAKGTWATCIILIGQLINRLCFTPNRTSRRNYGEGAARAFQLYVFRQKKAAGKAAISKAGLDGF